MIKSSTLSLSFLLTLLVLILFLSTPIVSSSPTPTLHYDQQNAIQTNIKSSEDDDEKICSICSERERSRVCYYYCKPSSSHPKGHTYCEECLQQHVNLSTICPMCRQPQNPTKITQLINPNNKHFQSLLSSLETLGIHYDSETSDFTIPFYYEKIKSLECFYELLISEIESLQKTTDLYSNTLLQTLCQKIEQIQNDSIHQSFLFWKNKLIERVWVYKPELFNYVVQSIMPTDQYLKSELVRVLCHSIQFSFLNQLSKQVFYWFGFYYRYVKRISNHPKLDYFKLNDVLVSMAFETLNYNDLLVFVEVMRNPVLLDWIEYFEIILVDLNQKLLKKAKLNHNYDVLLSEYGKQFLNHTQVTELTIFNRRTHHHHHN